MGFVLMIHSITRWLIVIVGIAVALKFAVGWLRKQDFKPADRGLNSAFTGLMDLQILLGVIYLVGDGIGGTGFPTYRVEHAITLIIAGVVAHLPIRWKSAGSEVRFRNTLLTTIGTLVLIYLGVAGLPGGWSR